MSHRHMDYHVGMRPPQPAPAPAPTPKRTRTPKPKPSGFVSFASAYDNVPQHLDAHGQAHCRAETGRSLMIDMGMD